MEHMTLFRSKMFSFRQYFIHSLLFSLLVCSSGTQAFWQPSNIGGGGAMNSVAAGPTGTIVVTTDLGGANIKRAAQTKWNIIGMASGLNETHITNVVFHPSNSNIIFLSADGGLFRTADEGEKFTRVDNVGGVFQDIAVAPSNPQVVYASRTPSYNSVAENNGTIPSPLMRSMDGGLTFNYVNKPQGSNGIPGTAQIIGSKVVVHPQDPDIVAMLSINTRFVNGIDEGVFVSTDGGQSWHHMAQNKPNPTDIEFHPAGTNSLFLGYKPTLHSAMIEHTDLTSSNNIITDAWYVALDSQFIYPLPGQPGHDNRVQPRFVIWPNASVANEIRVFDVYTSYYRFTDHDAALRVYHDGNNWTYSALGNVDEWSGGANKWALGWSKIHSILNPSLMSPAHTFGIDVSDHNRAFWVTNQFVFQITDNNDGTLAVSNLATTGDDATGWQSLDIDNITPFILDINKADPNVIYAGLNDLGCIMSLDDGTHWRQCIHDHASWPGIDGKSYGGIVTALASDPNAAGTVWMFAAGAQSTAVEPFVSTDFGATWTNLGSVPNTGGDVYGLSIDPSSSNSQRRLLVTGEGKVYRSIDHGSSWTSVHACNSGCRVTAIDPTNGYMYAGGEDGLWVSKMNGDSGSWQRILSGNQIGGFYNGSEVFAAGAWSGISGLAADDNNPGIILAAVFQNDTSQGVYRCDVSGAVVVDGNCQLILDDVTYIRDVAVAPTNSQIIYATSSSAYTSGGYSTESGGVYKTINGGTSWSQVNEGLEWPMAIPVEINPVNSSIVFIGSPGGGHYRRDFLDGDGDGLSDSFELSIGTDPANIDSDGDTLSDGFEVAYDGYATTYNPGTDLNPLAPDTDSDGFNDNVEITYNSDPLISGSVPATGDINEDGAVNVADVLLAQQFALGTRTPTATQAVRGDVAPLVSSVPTPDGAVTLADALLITRKALGLINF